MLIGINNQHQIKQIRDITNQTLTVIELDETSELYPFKNWSNAKILCYCYKNDNASIAVYPYINDKKIDEFEEEVLTLQAQVIELEFEKIGGLL